jgi:uncharacterized protein (UPF0548 family)
MLALRKPSAERLRAFLAGQSKLDLTYAAVGATAAVPPAGYAVDHTRIQLGEGAGTFAGAQAALRRWDHFRLGWVETWPPETPLQAGQITLWTRRSQSNGSASPTARCRNTPRRARSGSPWNGTRRTLR